MINILRNEVQSAAAVQYGDQTVSAILPRINRELYAAEHFRLAGQILAFYFLANHLKSQNIPYGIRGATANSFLLFLLGVTDVNPLPPHYYCPYCKSFVWDESQKNGYDLQPRVCTCGSDMKMDGHNLSWEHFWGGDLDTNNLRSSQQTMNMDVPTSAFNLSCDYLREQPLMLGIQAERQAHGQTIHFGKIVIQGNSSLPEHSKSWYHAANAEAVRSFACNHHSGSLSEQSVAPHTFREALRIYGMEHGTWLSEQVPVKPDVLSESIPVFFDDLFDLLSQEFTSKDAWMQSERIHFGQPLSDPANEVLTAEQSEWCNRAAYLFPRAHAVEYIFTQYRLYREKQSC